MINFHEIIFILLLEKNFDMTKIFRGFLENLFEYYFLNIIVNVNFFSDLNITVSTNLKYFHKQDLNKKLKLMGGAMKYFPKKLLGHKIFSPSYILNVRSLRTVVTSINFGNFSYVNKNNFGK